MYSKYAFPCVAIALLICLASPLRAESGEAHPGEKTYKRCASCHLNDGAGVPGAYPPLAQNVTDLASTERGREYLVYVSLKGVSGKLEIDGQTYRGIMSTVTSGLDDQQISDLLNFLITDVVSSEAGVNLELFSSEEVKRIRGSVLTEYTPRSILSVREEAFTQLSEVAEE